MYHHAKFHADRCHRRRYIYNRTDTYKHAKMHRITADLIRDKTHTSVAFVDKRPDTLTACNLLIDSCNDFNFTKTSLFEQFNVK